MKNTYFFLLLFFSSFLYSQNFDNDWKTVYQYELDGKIKSAQEGVQEIYKKAKRKKDDVQVIKCFFYLSKFEQVFDEKAQTTIVSNLKKEIKESKPIQKALLNHIYASLLIDYYSKNRYVINQRTNLKEQKSTDFQTWTEQDFTTEIDKALSESIKDEALLHENFIETYKEIFEISPFIDAKSYSLYDFLFEQNLVYQKTKINRWSYQTGTNDNTSPWDIFYQDSKTFTSFNTEKVEDVNLKKLLEMFQKNEKYYLTHNLQKADSFYYERLNYFYSIGRNQTLFLNKIAALEKKSSNENLKQNLRVERAKWYYNNAIKGSEVDFHRKALNLIDTIFAAKINNNALVEAENLQRNILQKTLNIQLQHTLYPNENARALVHYKNIDSIKISYYRLPVKNNDWFGYNYTYRNNPLISNDPLVLAFKNKNLPEKTYYRKLPEKKDHHEYSTEILLEKMDVGNYLIFIETEDTLTGEHAFAYNRILVTNFTVFEDEDEKNNLIYVLDRKTGKPINNADVISEEGKVSTNNDGKAFLKKQEYIVTKKYNNGITIVKNNDTLSQRFARAFTYKDGDQYHEEDFDHFEAKAMVYFDRAIYRPGQKMYYKGILLQNKDNVKSVVPYASVHVRIYDANHTSLKDFDVQTNEFGSFSGEFDIPKNTLSGQFSMSVNETDTPEADTKYYDEEELEHKFWDNVDFTDDEFQFQVEEYKRPTFEVRFNPITQNYTIGDSIKVTGNVKALAGNNITNAKVSYTVSKNSTGIKDYSYYQNEPDYIIKDIFTDEKGNFSIDFLATQENEKNENIELFDFYIKANVTDINGETRSANQAIRVGRKTLLLDISVGETLFTENNNTLLINATTLNNFPIDAKGEIKIYEIQQKNFLKKRQFDVPEIQTISKTEFYTLFPYEPYDNSDFEDNEILIKTLPFDNKASKKIALDFLKNNKTGQYKIVANAKDSNDNLITAEKKFKLESKKNYKSENQLFTYADVSKPNAKYFEIEFQSIIPDLYITSRFYADKRTIQRENVIQLQNGKGILKFPKDPTYKEDVYFHFSTVWENQSVFKIHSIEKEVMQQKLDIEVISMRNKIEPGSLENWSFKILDKKLEAEVLASMYDSSLDQFLEKNWTDIGFYNNNNNYLDYPNLNIYTNSTTEIKNFKSDKKYYLNLMKISLNWFGFDFNDYKNNYLRKKYLEKIQAKTTVPKNSKLTNGVVLDESGLPLPGVSIVVSGTTRGTQTDFDGYYEIDVAENEQLIFSYIGFRSKIIQVKEKVNDVSLELDSANLSEVVVSTGYKVQKKSASLAATIINANQEIDLVQSLQGMVVGLNITTANDQSGTESTIVLRGTSSINGNLEPLIIVDGIPVDENGFRSISQSDIASVSILKDDSAIAIYGSRGANGVLIITTKTALKELTQVKTRTNFNETAFFYPHLKTDGNGQFSFNFTTPESLTSWKLRLYAHNKKAETGYFQTDVISQKDVMVQTNMPRFVREKDTITISAKVVNMTNESKSGIAMLMLYEATNMKPIDSLSLNIQNIKNFVCKPKESVAVNWRITIPEGLQGLQYKIVAKSGNFSDGEENILPVMSNKILITESIPLWVKGNTKKEYQFKNLKNNTSTTLQHHLFTLEYTSNPVWLALQSLPYLMEYEHECAEQTFSRYYANFIATELINSNQKIADLFENWKKNPESTSKLNLNEELKSIVLNETPWLLDAENDAVKNKRLALLMDLNSMKESMEKTLGKIKEKQMPSGSFSWFDGGQENLYITQHIVAGLGHLEKMFPKNSSQFETITAKAIPYLDNQYIKQSTLKNDRINYYAYSNLHYLYSRSFHAQKIPVPKKIDSIINVQKVEFKTNWLHYSLYQKALLALTMNRFGDKDFAKKIITHLKETAARNTDNGMYWIENKNGYYWYQSSIETQALLIEAFSEIEKDQTYVDEMKVWLLKNKQTNHWPTTKSTSEAVYALLLQGNDWTSIKDNTKFKIGDEKVLTKKLTSKDKEADTGYIKMNWEADEISNKMGSITVDNKSEVPGYGGLYWQYFENLENIKTDSISTLSITKNLFKKEKTTAGEKLVELTDQNIKTGDLITIRLIIKTENDLEFVHLKDLRASCFEPVNVISQYQWQDRLGYYMSTKDVATHFFFDEIKKGTYVLEYDVRVNNAGHFNDGVSTLQSMYAPEFTQHSKSTSIKVSN